MTETTEEWLRRIGSKEAKEERVDERLSGPNRRRKAKSHPMECRCAKCVPTKKQPEMPTHTVIEPTVIPTKGKGFKQPVRKWDEQRGRSSN